MPQSVRPAAEGQSVSSPIPSTNLCGLGAKEVDVGISKDSKSLAMDNIMVERLWRTVK